MAVTRAIVTALTRLVKDLRSVTINYADLWLTLGQETEERTADGQICESQSCSYGAHSCYGFITGHLKLRSVRDDGKAAIFAQATSNFTRRHDVISIYSISSRL